MIIGIIGSLLFALCGLPQIYKMWKNKELRQGISVFMPIMVLLGSICMCYHYSMSLGWDLPTLLFTTTNIVVNIIILKFYFSKSV